jgi:hypothetical protein
MGLFFFYFVISQTALDKKGIAESFFRGIPIGFSLIVVHAAIESNPSQGAKRVMYMPWHLTKD